MSTATNLFIDTSGWGEILDARQNYHELATMLYAGSIEANHRIVTTNYVVLELVALLHSPLRFPRNMALEMVRGIRTSPAIEVVHITPEHDEAAWQLLQKYSDKTWSLCDAASFVVMREKNLSDALTTDHHFEQAGFHRLLK